MSERDRAIYNDLAAMITQQIPGFEVRYKRGDRVQEAIGWLVRPFIKGYVAQYTTTLYPRVYFPRPSDVERHPARAWKTLAHEYVHLWDARREGVLFSLRYVMPQALAVLALGALAAPLCPWALLCLGWLGALAPWPARWRTRTELRGYGMDLAIRWWTTGRRPSTEGLVRTFTGWSYYRMCGSDEAARAMLEGVVDALESGDMPFAELAEPFVAVRAVLERHGVVQAN